MLQTLQPFLSTSSPRYSLYFLQNPSSDFNPCRNSGSRSSAEKYLVDTFLTRSKTRPHFLLVLERSTPGKHPFFSVPEHNTNDKTATAIYRHDIMTHSTSSIDYYYFNSRPVNGFVCFTCLVCNLITITVCNPITRQIVKLPDIGNIIGGKVEEFLGYDPVEDQYKVLCVMMHAGRDKEHEHYVCTVSSSEKQEWRKIDNSTVDNYYTYVYQGQGVCIDGAIYYGVRQLDIVRFDVRSEKMEVIKAPKESNVSITCYSTLVNYNGRLGGVEYDYYKQEIILWILLEDVWKKEWSIKTFKYPCEWKGYGYHLESNGVIHTGELMLFQPSLKEAKPFCVYYYDFNKESSRKVEIQGMGIDELRGKMLCHPGYVENIRFL